MKKKEEKAAAKAKTSTRKRKAAEPADDGDEGVAETEPENVSKKPKRRSKVTKTQEKVAETDPESAEAVAPTKKASKPNLDEKPEAKRKSRSKPEGKAEGETKVVEPKAKAKRAAKAKAKAKGSSKKPVKDESEDDEEETDAQKLRRGLFQSDDNGSDGSDESDHQRLDAKTGKVEPLKDIFEKCEVDKHKAKMTGKRDELEPEQSTPKKGKSGKNKRKNKAKKMELSPFSKKEASRRKKKEKDTMQMEAKEDQQIQAIVRQHLKNVENLTYEDVKLYLRKHLTNAKQSEFKLNEYWGRPACGVKVPALGDGSLKKAPEVCYIGRYGTCPEGWNYHMACVYVSASLMASWFDTHVLGNKKISVFFNPSMQQFAASAVGILKGSQHA